MSVQLETPRGAFALESGAAHQIAQLDSRWDTAESFTVAIIDKRNLFSECMIISFQAADRTTRFERYESVEDWRSNHGSDVNHLVLLCMTDAAPAEQQASRLDLIALREANPDTKIVILSDQEDPGHILKALSAGAHGYVLTSISLRVVIQALQLVKAGGTFVPASSLQHLATHSKPNTTVAGTEMAAFSPRQLSVARALRKGTPNKLIAYQLNMCESTVKVHVRQIMKKLNAKNRTEVAFLTNRMFGAESG